MKQYYIKPFFALFTVIAILISSCSKDKDEVDLSDGPATITVKMKGIGLEDGSTSEGSVPVARASASVKASGVNTVQYVEVPFGDGLVVRGTLTELSASETPSLRASTGKAVTISTGQGAILPFTGNYTIYIYKKDSDKLVKSIDVKGGASTKFDLVPGDYRFVVSAFGNLNATGADKDPLAVIIDQTITKGENTLAIVLKHKLTEVTVEFSAAGYNIISIDGGAIKPNFDYSFDAPNGAVTFGQEITAKGLTFKKHPTKAAMISAPVMIAVDNSTKGEVKLTGVKLSSTKGGNITLPGLTLRKGVQYLLELGLGYQGIEVGGKVWSDGNLEYNPTTKEYGFGQVNTNGDYWFENRVKPKMLSQPNPTPSDALNGKDGELGGDPCALVAPKDAWRLPTASEAQALIDLKSRYIDYYNGATTDTGMFFGTNTTPGVNRDSYVFFPYAGYYPTQESVTSKGEAGAYIVKSGATYKRFWMTGSLGTNVNGGATASVQDVYQTWAMQIRCVKNTVKR